MTESAQQIPENTSRPAIDVFQELASEACRKLFKEYSLDLQSPQKRESPPKAAEEKWIASVIGFGSENLRGSITLAMPFRIVESTRPEGLSAPMGMEAAIHDWANELANQLLGRAKNQLLRYGVSIILSTPTSISGSNFGVSSWVSGSAQWYELASGDPTRSIWTLVNVIDEAKSEVVQLIETDGPAPPEEGELLLF